MRNYLIVAFTVVLLIFAIPSKLQAQEYNTAEISGHILSSQPLSNENIILVLNPGNKKAEIDKAGNFVFSNLAAGNYSITAYDKGKKVAEKIIDLKSGESLTLGFSIGENQKEGYDYQLDEVVIQGKTKVQTAKEQIVTAKVLDIQEVESRPSTLPEILNRASGIRIRESGGVGDRAEISINGFQGKSIRYFKDGIPLNYLGDGYSLSNIPLNTVQRVDVYKGVLPASLGSDALGGAVNIITSDPTKTALDASYQIGSFNTHKASIVGNYHFKEKNAYVGGEAFYNYADNDYKVSVRVPDPETKVPSWEKVRLFHNRYSGYFAEVYAGLQNKKWADNLRFSLAAYALHRNQQHPTLMTNPYGAIEMYQNSVVPSLRYEKSFFDKKLQLKQFAAYNVITRKRVDTLRGHYDWYGNFTPNPHKLGESPQAANSKINYYNFTARTNAIYKLTEKHTIEGNLVLTNVSRKGNDPLGIRFLGTDIDILTVPATYFKLVAGMSHTYEIIPKELTNNFQLKYYSYHSKGVDGFREISTLIDKVQGTNGSSWGIADALKYQFNNHHLLRLSVEYANRLPEREELFGNSNTQVPNFDLKPERSLNLNLNYRIQKSRYQVEAGVYYRQTRDLILLVPVQSPYAQHQNLEHVKGLGVDFDANIKITNYLNFTGNFTYNDSRIFGITDAGELWKNKSRLRNTPFFFFNLGLNSTIRNVFAKQDELHLFSYYNFVREFYLNFIPKDKEPTGFLGIWGESKIDITTKIPNQSQLSVGANYKVANCPINIAVEIKNLTNTNLYDYYRVQKAGRSFYLKISYAL